MKPFLAIFGCALFLAGCATSQPQGTASNNPLEVQCRAEGASGAALKACMRHKGALGVGRSVCERKGLKAGTAQMETCIKLEAQFTEATLSCQAQGFNSIKMDAFKACIQREAPEAAAYAMPQGV